MENFPLTQEQLDWWQSQQGQLVWQLSFNPYFDPTWRTAGYIVPPAAAAPALVDGYPGHHVGGFELTFTTAANGHGGADDIMAQHGPQYNPDQVVGLNAAATTTGPAPVMTTAAVAQTDPVAALFLHGVPESGSAPDTLGAPVAGMAGTAPAVAIPEVVVATVILFHSAVAMSWVVELSDGNQGVLSLLQPIAKHNEGCRRLTLQIRLLHAASNQVNVSAEHVPYGETQPVGTDVVAASFSGNRLGSGIRVSLLVPGEKKGDTRKQKFVCVFIECGGRRWALEIEYLSYKEMQTSRQNVRISRDRRAAVRDLACSCLL
ncbi:hypothetical protein BC828DRAFT_391943 [Blastocladiella britannica]|nr:hypothetical protein BC828DRAFT_391943 [Blastocladiella britannica]